MDAAVEIENDSLIRKETAADRDAGAAEQDLWRRFTESTTALSFCENWLSLQCGMLQGVRCGLLLLGPEDRGPFTPAAVWPGPEHNVTHLAPSAERALKERRGLLIKAAPDANAGVSSPDNINHVTYPIEVEGKLHGTVVLEVRSASADVLQDVMRKLHWGAAWLEVLIRRQGSVQAHLSEERLKSLLDGIATAVEHEGSQQAAMAFVTKLATTLDCERVSLGLMKGKQIKVFALSHSAGFGEKMNLVRDIGAAMDEAVDQRSVIVHPLPADAPPLAAVAHNELTTQHGSGMICTVPILQGTTSLGALMCERAADKPFDDQTVELIKTFAGLVGPVLTVKKKEERSAWIKLWESAVSKGKSFMGPDHPGLKLAAGVAVVVTLFFVFAKGDHRVRATTVLEGVVQRVITAPYNGYVAEAVARPGDIVRQGVLLCRLDERDLALERLKWVTQREQVLRQFSEAMAKHERAQIMIAQAKAEQADAQISLLDEQLSRSRIVAPFDGIITSGDLSQSLGSPVERGQVLFELAPLTGYRVIVQVDETDIGYVAAGQKGELALPSLPGNVLPLTVSKVTPISTAKEGRNYFRVEAQLERTSPQLRPGMEGVGKITVNRRRLVWIWSHEAIEWVRLKTWSWLP
jgi:multidrug efflux pump subunit AcrA (membrane-fusion protein)